MTTFCIGDDPTAFSPHPQFTPRGESHKVWRQEKEDQQAKPAQQCSRCVYVMFFAEGVLKLANNTTLRPN